MPWNDILLLAMYVAIAPRAVSKSGRMQMFKQRRIWYLVYIYSRLSPSLCGDFSLGLPFDGLFCPPRTISIALAKPKDTREKKVDNNPSSHDLAGGQSSRFLPRGCDMTTKHVQHGQYIPVVLRGPQTGERLTIRKAGRIEIQTARFWGGESIVQYKQYYSTYSTYTRCKKAMVWAVRGVEGRGEVEWW